MCMRKKQNAHVRRGLLFISYTGIPVPLMRIFKITHADFLCLVNTKIMKKLLFICLMLSTSCATIIMGPATVEQRTKPLPGQPQREVYAGYLFLDILCFGIPATIIDFATGAIYKPKGVILSKEEVLQKKYQDYLKSIDYNYFSDKEVLTYKEWKKKVGELLH